jgi:hypothetical protein
MYTADGWVPAPSDGQQGGYKVGDIADTENGPLQYTEDGWTPFKEDGQPRAAEAPTGQWAEDHPFAAAPVTAKEERSPWDMFLGGFETLGTMLTGATGGALGTVGGTLYGVGEAIADGTYGTQEGVQTVADRASRGGEMLTYAPRTEAGRDYVETVGEVAEVFAGAEGLAGPLAGPIATTRMGPSRRSVMRDGRQAEIANNPREEISGGQQVIGDGTDANPYRVIKDDSANFLMDKGGFTDAEIEMLKYASPETRALMAEQIRRSRNISLRPGQEGPDIEPSSVIGDQLASRASVVNQVRQKHGADIESSASTRKCTHVMTNDIADSYQSALAKENIKIDADGNLDFSNSRIPQAAQAALKEAHERINKYTSDGYADFYDLHNDKQLFSDLVNYDKSSSGGSAGVERIIKGVRSSINDTLRKNADDYAAANDGYAAAIEPYKKFAKMAGMGDIDWDDPKTVEMVALRSRSLANNTMQGPELREAMRQVNDLVQKYGDDMDPEMLASAGFTKGKDGQWKQNVNVTEMQILNNKLDTLSNHRTGSLQGQVRGADQPTAGDMARLAAGSPDGVLRKVGRRFINQDKADREALLKLQNESWERLLEMVERGL